MTTNRAKYSRLILPALLAGAAACSDGAATAPASPAATAARVGLGSGSVQSVQVAPTTLPTGGAATGSVRLASTVMDPTAVTLSTTTSGVLKIPSLVTVPGLTTLQTFRVNTSPGAAGCTRVVATTGSSSVQSEMIYVMPEAPHTSLGLSLADDEIVGEPGIQTTGRLDLVLVGLSWPPTASVVLSSSNPLVIVPDKVAVPLEGTEAGLTSGSAEFPVYLPTLILEPTCAVITATYGDLKSRVLLKVSPFPLGG